MDTLSCEWCNCRDVCIIVRNIDKAVESGIEPSRIIISGTGEVKQKMYKVLAKKCVYHSPKG